MTRSSTERRAGIAAAVLAVLGVIGSVGPVAACGADGPELAPLAAEGRGIIRERGCAACHGRNGAGGVGPAWVGLYGTMEELEGGGEVLVDDTYIRRSITDPGADRVAGYNVTMPDNTLTDDEIDAVIAYIEAIG